MQTAPTENVRQLPVLKLNKSSKFVTCINMQEFIDDAVFEFDEYKRWKAKIKVWLTKGNGVINWLERIFYWGPVNFTIIV